MRELTHSMTTRITEKTLSITRNRWKIAFFALLALSLLLLAGLGYTLLDQSATLTYREDEFARMRGDLAIVGRLLPAMQGRNDHRALLELLRKQNPTALIVATDSTITMDDLVFTFGADRKLRGVARK